MTGVNRRAKAAFAVSAGASLLALSTTALSCYPDFQFGATSSGDASTGTSSMKGSTSTAGALTGPPCQVTGDRCTFGEACCFDKVAPPTDHCGATCTSSFLSLYCATDAQCSDNKKCCAITDANGALTSTECRSSCSGSDVAVACDPATGTSCGCFEILAGYYTDQQAKAPYNQYGQCN